MGEKRTIALEVDRSELFDAVAKVGDGGQSLGNRLLGVLLGCDSFAAQVGLAYYGITIAEPNPTPHDGWQ